MPESYQLTVLSPTRTLLDQPVVSIIAPGSEGYLGVLAHHAPLITALMPGKLTVRKTTGDTHVYALSGGFLEVSHNHAVVLADALEEPGEIDIQRARRAAERARDRLKDSRGQWNSDRARAALLRALNRIQVCSLRG